TVVVGDVLVRPARTVSAEEWWGSSGRWRRSRPLAARPDEELRDFVDRFCRPEPDVVQAAEKMVELLSRWQVSGFHREEARRPPDEVCAVFVRLLCKKDFTYGHLRANHPDSVVLDPRPRGSGFGGAARAAAR